MSDAPFVDGFWYEVKLYARIPLKWAELLKAVAQKHYDYKCREAGECGVVNALVNVAHPDWQSTYPLSFGDCDLMMKIMEQAGWHGKTAEDYLLHSAIRKWLQDTMTALNAEFKRVTSESNNPH